MSNPVIPGDSRLSKKQQALLTTKSAVTSSPLTDHVIKQGEFVKDNHNKKIRVPQFSWPLPRWTGASAPVLVDNVPTKPVFHLNLRPKLHAVTLTDFAARMNALKQKYAGQLDHVDIDRSVETAPETDNVEPLSKAPHPDSDFSHVDKGVYTPGEKQQILNAIAILDGVVDLSKRDGELTRCIGQAQPPLAKVQALLAPNPRGMQRLKLVFEWTLCQVTAVFGEINRALDESNPTDYNNALDKYIELLRDLDDHDPHTHPSGDPVPGRRGYGITIKSPTILPLIFNGRIDGASVVVKWNPHLSSSGIPIPHD